MEKRVCILCGNSDFEVFCEAKDINQPKADDKTFPVLKCKICGLAATIADLPDFKELYREDFRDLKGERFRGGLEKIVNALEKRRINKVLKHKKRGRILDVGCGRGIFLRCLQKRSWDAYGIEISEKNARFLEKEHKIKMFQGDFTKINLPEKFFDVVTFWHVFEHFQDPSEALLKLKKILKDDGIVIIEAPNEESLQARVFKEKWFHLDAPRHLYHYSPGVLRKILKKHGFEALKVSEGEALYGFFGVLQSMLNKFDDKSAFFNAMKKDELTGQKKKKDLRSFFISGLLFAPALIFYLAEKLLKRWGVFEVSFKMNAEKTTEGTEN